MNIGIVTTWFERGAAYVSRQFMDVLQKTDNVYIYARGGEKYAIGNPKWDLPNVTWGKRDMPRMLMYGNTYLVKKDFKKWIDNNSIDILFFNEQTWMVPLIWCKEWKIRTVSYVDYYNELTIPLFNIYDGLICNTKRHAFAFRNHPHAHYLKWGTDINIYKPEGDKHEALVFFNSAGMAPVRKGTDLVIQAFYNCPNHQQAKLLIHTQVSLEATIPNVIPLVNELKKEGCIEIVEKTVTAPGLYHCADVYVYPSRLDGIGLTLMEAASSGLACVTVDNPPMNEFIEPSFGQVCTIDYQYCRTDGYYWPMCVANINSLSEIIENMIKQKGNVNEMKKEARKYAERELDFTKNMSKLHTILEQIQFQSDETGLLSKKINDYETSGLKKLYKYFYPLFWTKALMIRED